MVRRVGVALPVRVVIKWSKVAQCATNKPVPLVSSQKWHSGVHLCGLPMELALLMGSLSRADLRLLWTAPRRNIMESIVCTKLPGNVWRIKGLFHLFCFKFRVFLEEEKSGHVKTSRSQETTEWKKPYFIHLFLLWVEQSGRNRVSRFCSHWHSAVNLTSAFLIPVSVNVCAENWKKEAILP